MSDMGPEQPVVEASGSGAVARGPGVDDTVQIAQRDDATRLSGRGTGGVVSRREAEPERPEIEGYALREEAYRGGQGVVYKATQLSTKRTVALKVLLDGPFAGDVARRRFEREIELAASLRHPNIVRILDSGVSRGRYYFAMEYIEGRPLDRYLREEQPDLRSLLALLEQICLAVNFAHQRGVIHRDLKPSNILIDAEGMPQVLDFGLAKSRTSADAVQSTVRALSTPGQVMGTLAYMSPEQAAGSEDVDVRSDVYSLGVIAYEALLGRTPYPVEGSLGEILNRIARDDPAPPRSVRMASRFGRQIDDELATIVLKALEKDPARRYQSAGELAADIRRYLNGEPIEAKRASGFYVLRKTLKRYRLQATAGAAVLAMLLVFLILFAVLYRRESLARSEADELRQLATQRAQQAADAAAAAEQSRAQAERNAREALLAAEQRRIALLRQKLRSGDVAQLRGDLAEARDSYWEAFTEEPRDAAARWSLRQYYTRSGDQGAAQLYLARHGPVTLSPGGALAAVCETPYAVAVRSTADGRTEAWIPTPGAVRALDVDDAGRLAVAGDEWAFVYVPDAALPSAVAEWTARDPVQSCHVAGGGAYLLVVTASRVHCYRAADGLQVAEAELLGDLSGVPQYAPRTGQLAVPSSAGVELFTVGEDGTLAAELFWRAAPGQAARAVRFASDELLVVLADALRVSLLSGRQRGQWAEVVSQTRSWDVFDLRRGVGQIVLGDRYGRVAVYRGAAKEQEWRITGGRLEQLRLADDGQTLITLDDRGSLTRWDPRARQERRQLIHNQSPHRWAVSEDGSTMLMIDRSGDVLIYDSKRGPPVGAVLLPSIVDMVTGRDPEEMLAAISGDGALAVVYYGQRLWLRRADSSQPHSVPWREKRTPVVKELALSGDGALLAVYAQSERGDVQHIRLFSIERGRFGRPGLRSLREYIEFAGSTVRALRFLPGSRTLLIARSNGALVVQRIESPHAAGEEARPMRLEAPLAQLDAPAYRLAIDAVGHALAAACDDGVVRLISIVDGAELGRIPVGGTVGALAFNASGDMLLLRTDAGLMSLYPTDELEAIPLGAGAGGRHSFAAWLGSRDALLYDDEGGTYEVRFQEADRLVDAGLPYARRRLVARALSDGDFARAWQEAVRLEATDRDAARAAQLAILEQLLRRPHTRIPSEWLSRALEDLTPASLLRLGHAAYAGGRFAQAHEWLTRAEAALSGLDAYSAWRLAECDYLLDRLAQAAERLAALEQSPQLLERHRARVLLEQLAAHRMADRIDEARRCLDRMQAQLSSHWPHDPIASLAALAVGAYLLDSTREGQLAETFERLLTVFREQWLLYRDDSEFFAGELARFHGDASAARLRYQNCIDLSRDAWPANWAAFRLRSAAEEVP